MTVDDLDMYWPWSCFYEQSHVEDVGAALRSKNRSLPWAYLLPPAVGAILSVDDFWRDLNQQLGVERFFDHYEETELEPVLSAHLANKIEQFIRDKHYTGVVSRSFGTKKDGKTQVTATIEADELRESLVGLVDFLRKASKQEWIVCACI